MDKQLTRLPHTIERRIRRRERQIWNWSIGPPKIKYNSSLEIVSKGISYSPVKQNSLTLGININQIYLLPTSIFFHILTPDILTHGNRLKVCLHLLRVNMNKDNSWRRKQTIRNLVKMLAQNALSDSEIHSLLPNNFDFLSFLFWWGGGSIALKNTLD